MREYFRDLQSVAIRFSAKGLLYCQVLLPGEKVLHLINTHLQAGTGGQMISPSSYCSRLLGWCADVSPLENKYERVRKQQIEMIGEFIEKILESSKMNPFDAPLLLCGDFNINARFTTAHTQERQEREAEKRREDQFNANSQKEIHAKEYVECMTTLKKHCTRVNGKISKNSVYSIKDPLYEHCGYHPVTFGDGPEDLDTDITSTNTGGKDAVIVGRALNKKFDTALTLLSERNTKQRLDYMFWISTQPTSDPHAAILKLIPPPCLKTESMKVAPIYVPEGLPNIPQSLTQLSDHYGVEGSLELF